MAIIRPPNPEDEQAVFDTYCMLVGRAAHAWNYLFEQLAIVFRISTCATRPTADAIWYAIEADRLKMKILKEVIGTSPLSERTRGQQAEEDIVWLINRVNELTETRNNIVHAPIVMYVSEKGTDFRASGWSRHDRARKLRGKDLAVEMEWFERYTEALSRFTLQLLDALNDDARPWPKRPGTPDRKSRTDLQTRLGPQHPIERPAPPESSQG